MYSHEVIEFVKRRNYVITIKELNKLLSDSLQAYYEVIYEEYDHARVRILFHDRNDNIELNVMR